MRTASWPPVDNWPTAASCRRSRARNIRLPAETEWGAAARGTHARAWPWGEDESRACRSSREVLGMGRTSPVGVSPGSGTPAGAVDMAGKVWEWSSSAYPPEDLSATAAQRAPTPGCCALPRGGCHQVEPNMCGPDYRFKSNPLMRNKIIGFRLVCDPAATSTSSRARALRNREAYARVKPRARGAPAYRGNARRL